MSANYLPFTNEIYNNKNNIKKKKKLEWLVRPKPL